ncbi:hypothetical protein [Alicyclobacillus herbarius]|uniref:Y-family DNA polymerase n=1 Tax=Alicyclobacillus herbarius TaxID=122960 RepID=UPI0004249AFE|nr:hypothetical protein [Alicyclobacillus herbarius]
MRYTLFGFGEGVRIDEGSPLWASIQSGKVSDASTAAREQGIQPGMSAATAQSLLPGLRLFEETGSPSQTMERVWHTLWKFSPWLETVGYDSFFLQIPGARLPFSEVRQILRQVDVQLPRGARFFVGLAETPKLARALVQWARCRSDRPPGAGYRVGRQYLWISPVFSRKVSVPSGSAADAVLAHACDSQADRRGRTDSLSIPAPKWIHALPIDAMWFLSAEERERLKRFGVFQYRDLFDLPDADFIRQFGRESLLWKQVFAEIPPGHLQVNYPPFTYSQIWRAHIGETLSAGQIPEVVARLAARIADFLEKWGNAAHRQGIVWRTVSAEGRFEQATGQPVYRLSTLMAHWQEGIHRCQAAAEGEGGVETIKIYVADLQPLTGRQSGFILKNGLLLPDNLKTKEKLEQILGQVNGRHPGKLRIGIRGSFRELRWRAVVEA